jgi:hypothetical protein
VDHFPEQGGYEGIDPLESIEEPDHPAFKDDKEKVVLPDDFKFFQEKYQPEEKRV